MRDMGGDIGGTFMGLVKIRKAKIVAFGIFAIK
jgi:hypothetical protein